MNAPGRLLVIYAVIASVLGCSAPEEQKREEPQTVQMKDQMKGEMAEERPPPPPTEVETAPPPPPPEELALEMLEVTPEEPVVTEDGVEIHMRSGPPDWHFELVKGGQTVTAEQQGESLYIEGVAFGEMFVFAESGESVQVTLRSDAPTQPLRPEEALELARRERESRLACEGTRDETSVEPNGTVVLRVLKDDGSEACRIVVGRYTGDVVDL